MTFCHTVLVDTPCLFLSQQRVAASLPLYWSIKSKSHTNFNFTSYFCVSSGTLVSSSIFQVQVHHVIKPLLFEGFDCFNALIAIFLEFLVSLFDKKHHIVPSRTPLHFDQVSTQSIFSIFLINQDLIFFKSQLFALKMSISFNAFQCLFTPLSWNPIAQCRGVDYVNQLLEKFIGNFYVLVYLFWGKCTSFFSNNGVLCFKWPWT